MIDLTSEIVVPTNARINMRERATDSAMPPYLIEIHVPLIWNADDFTVYVEAKSLDISGDEAAKNYINNCLMRDKSLEAEVTLLDTECICEGRALICLCAKTEWVSITLRRNGKLLNKTTKQPADNTLCEKRKLVKGKSDPTKYAKEIVKDDSGKITSGFDEEDEKNYLNPVYELYNEIYKLLFPSPATAQGLIVVAGSTGTGKSQVVRGIIDLYFRDQIKLQDSADDVTRRPHFVTYEDPIEKLAFSKEDSSTKRKVFCREEAVAHGIDYTPRLKKADVENLANAFLDAKRQTPALFYIGEVRDNEEWKQIVTFAGEGNLVIATTHANSVVETISKIFKATGVKTPADRGQIAGRFISFVHLRPYTLVINEDLEDGTVKPVFRRQAALPALWRNTPQGVKGLVSDGLGSVLPYYLTTGKEDYSSIGRRFFAERFAQTLRQYHSTVEWDRRLKDDQTLDDLAKEELIKAAIGFDLEEI